jgi:hypothetical protein
VVVDHFVYDTETDANADAEIETDEQDAELIAMNGVEDVADDLVEATDEDDDDGVGDGEET